MGFNLSFALPFPLQDNISGLGDAPVAKQLAVQERDASLDSQYPWKKLSEAVLICKSRMRPTRLANVVATGSVRDFVVKIRE